MEDSWSCLTVKNLVKKWRYNINLAAVKYVMSYNMQVLLKAISTTKALYSEHLLYGFKLFERGGKAISQHSVCAG